MQKISILLVLFVSLLSVTLALADSASREDPLETVNKSNPSTDEDDSPIVNPGDYVPHKYLPSTQWKALKRSKYLTYLFRKYGSGGLITFEVCNRQWIRMINNLTRV